MMRFIGILGASFVILLAGCGRSEKETAASKANTPAKSATTRDFATPWQDESQYIVTQVASDLAEMAWHASQRDAPASPAAWPVITVQELSGAWDQPAYRVTVEVAGQPEITCDLPLDQAIWSPVSYGPLTALLFERWQLKDTSRPVVADRGSDLVQNLTEPTARLLAGIDERLSGQLEASFTFPGMHERAAFLLGAFAWREASGNFFQIRFELCRMTAHLAFAQALRGRDEPAVAGRLAEAILMTLYNDQVAALTAVAAVPDAENTTAWKRAIHTRVTRDYRLVADGETLLEKLAWHRAYAEAVDGPRAWDSLRLRENWAALPDWRRVAYMMKPSVGLGHEFLRHGLDQELDEAAQVYRAETGDELAPAQLASALNVEPERCVVRAADGTSKVRILGWGLWAAFLQRHLCHTIASDFDFMQNRWGVPQQAAGYRDEMDRLFEGLYLYPFVRRQNATAGDYYRKAQDDEMALIRSRPHLVPALSWNIVNYTVPFAALYYPPPHPFVNQWHLHNPPPGTVYDILPRLNHPSLVSPGTRGETLARLEKLHARAPYDIALGNSLVKFRDGNPPPPDKVAAAFQPMLDYYAWPSRWIAQLSADPVQQEKWLRQAAAIDPWTYRQLAELFVRQQRESDAAEAYARWIDGEVDSVAVANSARWLVNYYERTGQGNRALALADRAASTFSSEGLATKAALLEQRRDFDGALEIHEVRAERYSDSGSLMGFLLRRQAQGDAGNERYVTRFKALVRQNLPDGLTRFELAAGSPPPTRGVIVHTEADWVGKAGLKRNDVIVAVRGYTVYDWNSFKTIRGFEPEQPYTMLVWRSNGYVKVGPLPGDYRFGVNLTSYRKP